MRRFATILTLAILAFASAQSWQASGEVRYFARDALAAWSGVAPLAEALATFDPSLPGDIAFTARVETGRFSSGNFLRDQRARAQVFRSADHPEAILSARGTDASLPPLAAGGTLIVPLAATLTLAGVTLPYAIELTLTAALEPDGALGIDVSTRFAVSLDAHGMVRPALLGLVTEDLVWVQVTATARRAP